MKKLLILLLTLSLMLSMLGCDNTEDEEPPVPPVGDTPTEEEKNEATDENGFTLVGTADKSMSRKGKKVTFTYGDETYSTTYGLSVGGNAKFGTYRYVSFTTEAGTYSVGSAGSGMYIFTIIIEHFE